MDNYIKSLEKQGIQSTFARWYVIRAEQYIQAYPEKRLAQHQRAEVDQYLHELGRKTTLKTWQFQQAVHAIQILFQHVLRVDFSMYSGLIGRNQWIGIIGQAQLKCYLANMRLLHVIINRLQFHPGHPQKIQT